MSKSISLGCGLLSFNDTGIGMKSPWLCPPGATQPCIGPLQDAFDSDFSTAGECAITFAVLMIIGLGLVCTLMNGVKQKKQLEEIQNLHRKFEKQKRIRERNCTVCVCEKETESVRVRGAAAAECESGWHGFVGPC